VQSNLRNSADPRIVLIQQFVETYMAPAYSFNSDTYKVRLKGVQGARGRGKERGADLEYSTYLTWPVNCSRMYKLPLASPVTETGWSNVVE
jgi:hypothetical protein